jgi:hypothetical protein
MSVAEAQDDVSFIISFQDTVVTLIRNVQEWESTDSALDIDSPDRTALDEMAKYRAWYDREHTTISTQLVRFQFLCLAYRVTFPENLLFVVPTSGKSSYNSDYRYSFPEVSKQAILRSIQMLRGAAERNLADEQQKALEEQNRPPIPRSTRLWRIFTQTLDLLDKRGYLKPVVFTGLALLIIWVLHLAGFDFKTALEVYKSVKP